MTETEHKSLARRLGRAIKVYRQIARRFAHFRTHTSHSRRTAGINKFFATGMCSHFQKSNRRTSVVHEHRTRGIAPTESHVNAGITANESRVHFFEVRQCGFDKRYIRIRPQSRNLVRVACRNNDFMSTCQKGLDHIMPNKAGSTRNKDSHIISFLSRALQYRFYHIVPARK